jgi:hypothetical protein
MSERVKKLIPAALVGHIFQGHAMTADSNAAPSGTCNEGRSE